MECQLGRYLKNKLAYDIYLYEEDASYITHDIKLYHGNFSGKGGNKLYQEGRK